MDKFSSPTNQKDDNSKNDKNNMLMEDGENKKEEMSPGDNRCNITVTALVSVTK